MKKIQFTLLCFVAIATLSAQDKPPKTGWKFGGALPAVSYDTDLGFQYGALVKFFNYGNPGVFLISTTIFIWKRLTIRKAAEYSG